MFKYEKTLEYPVNVKKKDLRMAKLLVDQLGGPSGELGACLRYLLQRFTMPDDKGKALLSDIGCEDRTLRNDLYHDKSVNKRR